jgi:hypothetical protein
VAIWNLEKLFPGRAAGITPAAFLLDGERPAKAIRGAFAALGTLFMAGELRSSGNRLTASLRVSHAQTGRRRHHPPSFPDLANAKAVRPQSLWPPVSYLRRSHAPIRNDMMINATDRSPVKSQIMRISCVRADSSTASRGFESGCSGMYAAACRDG